MNRLRNAKGRQYFAQCLDCVKRCYRFVGAYGFNGYVHIIVISNGVKESSLRQTIQVDRDGTIPPSDDFEMVISDGRVIVRLKESVACAS